MDTLIPSIVFTFFVFVFKTLKVMIPNEVYLTMFQCELGV